MIQKILFAFYVPPVLTGYESQFTGPAGTPYSRGGQMVFKGALTMEEIGDLAEEQKARLSSEWRRKAANCPENEDRHSWITIAWTVSGKGKHLSTLMCTNCFHEINISEVFHHRTKL